MKIKMKSSFAGQTNEPYITTLRNLSGFLVRIPYPQIANKQISKTFRVKDKSINLDMLLNEAIKWRDSKYFELYSESVPVRAFHNKVSNGSTSIVGVRKIIKTVKKKLKDGSIAEYKIPCLIAEIFLEVGENYKKPRKSKSKIFSLNNLSSR